MALLIGYRNYKSAAMETKAINNDDELNSNNVQQQRGTTMASWIMVTFSNSDELMAMMKVEVEKHSLHTGNNDNEFAILEEKIG